MTTWGTPAGWYPDPASGNGIRWWDGAGWTSHFTPYAAPALRDEEAPARRARIALLIAGPAQVIATSATMFQFRHVVNEMREARDTFVPWNTTAGGRLANVAMQLLGAVGTVTAVLFLIWFARSAANARDLGLPARREPAAAVAGFLVPIINLWWPYGSTCDLFPDRDNARPMVLRWFLLWLLGGFFLAVMSLVSVFQDTGLAIALQVLGAIPVLLAALAARQVVARAVEAHATLAAARSI